MPSAISNTSPLLYLHRINALAWLPELFDEVWMPSPVDDELREGRRCGFDTPDLAVLPWIHVVEPPTAPAAWRALELGDGELAALAIGQENPTRTLLLDDALARRTAQAAGLHVWGTLRIMVEAKNCGLTDAVGPWLDRLAASGLWFTDDVRRRILRLAGEAHP